MFNNFWECLLWVILQKSTTEQHHAIHLLLLYPREQPIESEASPVSCIIAPPIIYKRVYAMTVTLVSTMVIICEDVALNLSTWRTLCPTLDRAADTTDSVKPATKDAHQQDAYPTHSRTRARARVHTHSHQEASDTDIT